MRKIDWDKALSKEDIAWLRQAGIPGMTERIDLHQAQFKAEVPEVEVPEDTLTTSALDPQGRVANQVPEFGQLGAPQLVDPTQPTADAEITEDDDLEDYDSWSKEDLDKEVVARNKMADTSEVTVVGTGKDGNVLKADLVKGLKLWDQENPDAFKD